MAKRYDNIGFILICVFLLSGCGFTLRAATSLPPRLHQIYYQTDDPYGQFEVMFKKLLKASNATLLSEPNKTAVTIHVASNYNHSTKSAYSSVDARTYALNYTATFSISDASGKVLLNPQIVNISRDIILASNEMIETTPQIDNIKYEMQQELSTKILNILSAKKTFQILAVKTK